MAAPEPLSFFAQLCAEAVSPWVLTLPYQTKELTWVVPAPLADGVAELDEINHPLDILSALVGDEVGDDILLALEPLDWSVTVDSVASLRKHFALAYLDRGMWAHVVERIDLYGEEIESDLSGQGHDLLDWFRGKRPWPQLIRLVGRLPPGSRFWGALADDEDLARERIDQAMEVPEGRPTPPWEGETQDRMLLRSAVSILLRVEHAIYAVNAPKGQAGTPPRPLPSPVTAETRLRDSDAAQEIDEIFDSVTPGWRGEG